MTPVIKNNAPQNRSPFSSSDEQYEKAKEAFARGWCVVAYGPRQTMIVACTCGFSMQSRPFKSNIPVSVRESWARGEKHKHIQEHHSGDH